MEGIKGPQAPTQAQTHLILRLLIVCTLLPLITASAPAHQPLNLTWKIIATATGEVVNATSRLAPRNTWWPQLEFDLCDLAHASGTWDHDSPEEGYGCKYPGYRASLRNRHFYVCPGHDKTDSWIDKCGGPEQYFCASWGCESTGHIWWEANRKDLITVHRGGNYGPYTSNNVSYAARFPGSGTVWIKGKNKGTGGPCHMPPAMGGTPGGRCNQISLTFTESGKQARWESGKTWGLRIHRPGPTYDPGLLFTIQLTVNNIKGPNQQAVGPSPVLRLKTQRPGPPHPPTTSPRVSTSSTSLTTPDL
ncbi:MLV-related proviral Env polyprotein-like [Meriones unguiculatus]|uniref:MLV-related proviral Env polyprotein-like n=1 Tax=Meriones unguiculatus TaxID=10047 RepID=UPI000B4EB917|nr:MLV-related proviral Env polyprotein-like [Meriones unguiculatus]XP_060246463.1 MLV-related proviral Env polyprotein-like [Meriones unguiculatus]